MVLHDQHVHSSFSHDSNEDILNYVEASIKQGCKYFITTEHIDFDLPVKHETWSVDFNKLQDKLQLIKSTYPIIPLLGVELGYKKEYIQSLKKIIKNNNFDLINLSIHDNGEIEYYYQECYKKYGIKETLTIYYEQVEEALDNFLDFDVLSHLDYAYKTAYLIDNSYDFFNDLESIKTILQKLIKLNKTLEINTKVQKYLPDEHLFKLLNLYKSLGGTKLSLSSDAHTVNRYLENFHKYQEIIKKAGFDYLCYYIKRKEYRFII
jgi:histidinol-phosphatase (PHP family)